MVAFAKQLFLFFSQSDFQSVAESDSEERRRRDEDEAEKDEEEDEANTKRVLRSVSRASWSAAMCDRTVQCGLSGIASAEHKSD